MILILIARYDINRTNKYVANPRLRYGRLPRPSSHAHATTISHTTLGYGMDAFHEDVKNFLKAAGTSKGIPTMYLMADTQIIIETFVEDINNILNSGEVPSLFANDEIDAIVNDLRPVAKANGRSEAKDAVRKKEFEGKQNFSGM